VKSTEQQLPNDAISFRDSLFFIWEARLHMFGGLVVGLVVATLFLITSHPEFEASISVAPPNISLPDTNFSGGEVGTGTLSSLLGIKAGNDGPGPYDRATFMFHSRELAEKLSHDPVIMHTIFAGDWDARGQRWVHHLSVSSTIHDFVSWLFGRGSWMPPGPDALSDYIQGAVLLKPSDQHGVTIITYRNVDGRFAKYFLGMLVATSDGAVREADRQRYELYQSYLTEQIGKTNAVDVRQSLIALFIGVTQRVMLVSSRANYSMDILDGPKVSAWPVAPSIAMTFLIFVMIGIAVGAALAIAQAGELAFAWTIHWSGSRPHLVRRAN